MNKVAERPGASGGGWAKLRTVLALMLALYLGLSAAEFVRTLLWERTRSSEVSLYPAETLVLNEGSREFRWTRGATGKLLRPLYGPVMRLPLYLAHPDLPAEGVRVRLMLGDDLLDDPVLAKAGWHRLDYYLPAALGEDPWRESPERMALDGFATLELVVGDEPYGAPRVARQTRPDYLRVFTGWGPPPGPPSLWIEAQSDATFVPADFVDPAIAADNWLTLDRRQLGVGMGQPLWMIDLPAGGVGLWPLETDGDREFRWSRTRASLPVPAAVLGEGGPETLEFLVRPAAPDAADQPVEVDFFWNEDLVMTTTLTEPTWAPVRLRAPTLQGAAGVLSLRVSRAWNPARAGAAPDNRELGVAITSPRWAER